MGAVPGGVRESVRALPSPTRLSHGVPTPAPNTCRFIPGPNNLCPFCFKARDGAGSSGDTPNPRSAHAAEAPHPFPIPSVGVGAAPGGGLGQEGPARPRAGPPQGCAFVTNAGPVPDCSTGSDGARVSPPSAPGAVPSRHGDVRAQDQAAEPPSALLGHGRASPGSGLRVASDFFIFFGAGAALQGWGCRCCTGIKAQKESGHKGFDGSCVTPA